jgi:hypothetical protein
MDNLNDEEYISIRFSEIVDEYYISESRFPRFSRLSAGVGTLAIMSVNKLASFRYPHTEYQIDHKLYDVRQKARIGVGVLASAGAFGLTVAFGPLISDTSFDMLETLGDGFRSF